MATQIEFHTGVGDVPAFTCRLLRKACRRGARVAVTAEGPVLRELDRALWTFDERDFVPHRVWGGPGQGATLETITPIWLLADGWRTQVASGLPPVLVNLGADVVDACTRFERVIEVVGHDSDAAQAARARWRRYREQGLPVMHHLATTD